MKDYRLVTNGAAQSPTTLDLDVPRLRPVLPHAESLTLLSNTEGLQTGFQWDVQLVPGFDRNHELAAFQLVGGGHITANGPLRHGAIGTNANFLPEVRAQLWCQNGAGVTGATSALVSAVLAVQLFGL